MKCWMLPRLMVSVNSSQILKSLLHQCFKNVMFFHFSLLESPSDPAPAPPSPPSLSPSPPTSSSPSPLPPPPLSLPSPLPSQEDEESLQQQQQQPPLHNSLPLSPSPPALPSPSPPPPTLPPSTTPPPSSSPPASEELPQPSPASPPTPEDAPTPQITSLHLAKKQSNAAITGESEDEDSESGGEGIFRERDEFVVRTEDIGTLKVTSILHLRFEIVCSFGRFLSLISRVLSAGSADGARTTADLEGPESSAAEICS